MANEDVTDVACELDEVLAALDFFQVVPVLLSLSENASARSTGRGMHTPGWSFLFEYVFSQSAGVKDRPAAIAPSGWSLR